MRSPSDAVGSPFAFDSGALSTNANVEPGVRLEQHFCLVLATAVVCVVLAFAITENGVAPSPRTASAHCHEVFAGPFPRDNRSVEPGPRWGAQRGFESRRSRLRNACKW